MHRLITFRAVKVFAIVVSVAIGNSAAVENDFPDRILPEGVKLGLAAEQVRSARSQAALIPIYPTGRDGYNFVERLSPFTFAWYYVRKGKVAGFMRTTMASHLDPSQRTIEEERMTPKASDGFAKDSESEALRAGTTLRPQVIKVIRWKTKSDALQLFTVNSTDELSIIAFQPSLLSWNDFFVGLDMKNKLEAEQNRIARLLVTANAQEKKDDPPHSSLSSQTAASTLPSAQSVAATTKVSTDVEIKSQNSFPTVLMAVIAAVLIGAMVFLLRRKG